MSRVQSFSHLHTHSHYSLLQALPQIPDLVKAAKEDGQKALALTDSGNLYGAIDFYKECTKQEIKPIIGCDVYVAPRSRHDKEHNTDNHTTRLVLLAQNNEGYHNLIRVVSKSFLEGFYYTPRVDRELLEQYHEGLVAIMPSFSGEITKALNANDTKRAEESLHWHKKTFADNLYIEVTRHPEIDGHNDAMKKLASFAQEKNIPLTATHDCYYLKQDDALARELVNHIRTGRQLDRDMRIGRNNFAFLTQKEAREAFKDMPEALENTQKIAEACNIELALGKAVFPSFPIPKNSTHKKELRALAEKGIEERGMKKTPELGARLDHELKIIGAKEYETYFLIVADLLAYARENDILTNTRGSAAGSLVSYLCGITTVDPIKFNMPFERFLNPERPTAPDIDMDIADNRRDELIRYAREKYGEDHVAQIGTFGTMMARAAVRDVARALGHSYGTGDQIAKLIPFGAQGFPMTIERALNETSELKEVRDNDADAKEILDLAQKIEGNARHVGVHAAGVVISPRPLTEYVPIQLDPRGGKTITQYDMYSLADEYGGIGLLKFDVLGLKNLSVLADSIARVKNRLNAEIDIHNLPMGDKKTYGMLSRGETLGVFQLSGSGMTSYLKELKPERVHDINAMVALYRPGPMAFIPDYIERKHNPSLVKYLDPRLEKILEPTYGVLVYQDDVMTIAVELAGYTWVEADKLRKAMGKKIPKEMKAQEKRFREGCVERDVDALTAGKLWSSIETFAAYGFNKAHAASYGNLAYQTAYMKANFPVDYMAAVLTADSGDVEKIGIVVAECARMGITVLPPDINQSFTDFTVINESEIRFGLTSIKNFGSGIAESIINERLENGTFKSLGDFLARITDKNLNKKSLEALTQSGALDALGERGQMLEHLDLLLQFHKEHMHAPENQDSLFATAGGTQTNENNIELPPAKPAPTTQRLSWEKELLGLYVSGHPLDAYKERFENQKLDIKATKEKLPKGVQTVIAGLVERLQPILTKKGERMAFLNLADYHDSVEVVCFPRVFKEFGELIEPEGCVMIKGRMSDRNGEKSFIAEAVKRL